MTAASALIDKSFFQRLCDPTVEANRQHWDALHKAYQLVIPVVLIEEVLTNVVLGKTNRHVIEEMAAQVVELQSCWLDDAYEIAYRELVRREAVRNLPSPDPEFVQRLLNLKKNNPELRKWAE